ncbi:hypothetical protein D3C74_271720 [compost metagenome]
MAQAQRRAQLGVVSAVAGYADRRGTARLSGQLGTAPVRQAAGDLLPRDRPHRLQRQQRAEQRRAGNANEHDAPAGNAPDSPARPGLAAMERRRLQRQTQRRRADDT